MSHLKQKLIIFFSASVLLVSILAGYLFYQLFFTPLIQNDSGVVVFEVEPKSSAYTFIQNLNHQQLIHTKKPYLLWIKFQGLTQKLKAGYYEIKPGESFLDLLHHVSHGEALKGTFVIIEGTTKNQIEENLKNTPYLKKVSLNWRDISKSYPNAEGLLLADTYQYLAGSDGNAILILAHKNLMNHLETAWRQRSPILPYKTPYELLTAASIIEKESSLAQERRLISGVIVNRLKRNMPLQMDPTVIYGLGSRYNGKLTHKDLEIDTPYNSYKYRGLPPTPIAMVGKDSIDAAAHPLETQFLYFVSKGDGSHQFSATYDQQLEAIRRYQRGF